MMEAQAACLLCGHTAAEPYYRANGDTVWRCRSCRLLFRSVRASVSEQRTYYTAAYYHGKPAYFTSTPEHAAGHSRLQMYQRILDQLARMTAPGLIGDGGCGLGAFVALARARGWRPLGVELSAHAAQVAQGSCRGAVSQGDLRALPWRTASLDAMCLLDVLGDCADPRAALQEARRVLRARGVLVVASVAADSLLYRAAAWSYRWSGGRFTRAMHRGLPADHTAFFSMATLQALLRQEGFRIIHAERFDEGLEHVVSFTPWWLRGPLAAITACGRLIGRPLENCVYAVAA